MSRYAELVCLQCNVKLWLGKAVFRPDGDQIYLFAIRKGPNSENSVVTRALWKMLADHARHPLKVVVEGDQDHDDLLRVGSQIGGDTADDIPFDKFLEDGQWPG